MKLGEKPPLYSDPLMQRCLTLAATLHGRELPKRVAPERILETAGIIREWLAETIGEVK